MLAAGLPIGKSLAEKDLGRRQGRDRGDEGARRAVPIPVDVVTAKEFKADASRP